MNEFKPTLEALEDRLLMSTVRPQRPRNMQPPIVFNPVAQPVGRVIPVPPSLPAPASRFINYNPVPAGTGFAIPGRPATPPATPPTPTPSQPAGSTAVIYIPSSNPGGAPTIVNLFPPVQIIT